MNRLLLVLMVFAGCSSPDGGDRIYFEVKEVDKSSLLIPAESPHEVEAPSEIKAVSGGFLVYDYGIGKIFKLDSYGNKLISFGNRGRGPGEYQEVFNFWEFDGLYWILDYNNAKFLTYDWEGNWIEDVPINFEGFPDSPAWVELISPHQFVIPSDGKSGSLLTRVDMEMGNVRHFGEAVGEYAGHDPEEARHAISRGRVPADDQNKVLLSSNRTGIFSFQMATAILEKYTHSGELVWQKSVKIPAIEDLFEHLFQENRRRITRGEFLFSFTYGLRINANEEGVAILLNVPEEQPLTVVWVDNDGQNGKVVTFPEIEKDNKNRLLGVTFTILADGSYIFFTDALDGELYRAEWPR